MIQQTRIGILSDTHGNLGVVESVATHPEAQNIKTWLHAGDCAPDAKYLCEITGAKVYGVAGNCDWIDKTDAPLSRVLEIAGHRIFLAHGHSFGVQYSTESLYRAAEQEACDIAVYGHTHVAAISLGKVILLNPGSAARPRDSAQGSFMILDFSKGERPRAKLIRLL